MTDDSVPSAEMRAHWRKMEQYERAVENIEHWQAEIDNAKKYLKKWKATAKRLKEELDLEGGD